MTTVKFGAGGMYCTYPSLLLLLKQYERQTHNIRTMSNRRITRNAAAAKRGAPVEEEEEEEAPSTKKTKEEVTLPRDEYEKIKKDYEQMRKDLMKKKNTASPVVAIGELNMAQTATLALVIRDELFKILPLPTNETFKAQPWILNKCLTKMKIHDADERIAKRTAAESLIKKTCSAKRSYICRKLYKLYEGK